MPDSLRQTMGEGSIPMPQYDNDGVFKTYLQPRDGFKHNKPQAQFSSIKDFDNLR